MIRTQISLTVEQHHRLGRVARARGVSIAALIRQAVDDQIPDENDARRQRWQRASAVVGRHASGLGDLAAEHDRHLDDGDRW